MSKTLEELRADLARFVGMFRTGTADSGSTKRIVDLAGLATVVEADALNGGLAYIRTAGAAAPEEESERVDDYVPVVHPSAAEIVLNGGFETAGGGGADVFGSWTESVGDGAITQDGTIYMEGAKSAKLTSGPNKNTKFTQTFTVVGGAAYKLTLYHYATAVPEGGGSIYSSDLTEYILPISCPNYGASWVAYEWTFVVPVFCESIILTLHAPEMDGRSAYYDSVSLQLCGYISLAAELTAAVASGDVYEVYLAPLTLKQWDQAINQAIASAWPQVFAKEMWETESAEASDYLLPDDTNDVLEVAVAFRGQYQGVPNESMARNLWRVEGLAGTDLVLHLHRIVPAEGRDLNVYYKAKYAELAAAESTSLDAEYLMLAGAARLYHMLAAEAGPQSSSSRYIQLMQYYDSQAQERRDLLEADLMGLPIEARWQRKKGK